MDVYVILTIEVYRALLALDRLKHVVSAVRNNAAELSTWAHHVVPQQKQFVRDKGVEEHQHVPAADDNPIC